MLNIRSSEPDDASVIAAVILTQVRGRAADSHTVPAEAALVGDAEF